ncbi:hypothetical protein QJQ45_023867 [Haematococcus lacustris]|nr:hypothetical protein QJQ45_023867 [Haematococcus lacustris]
MTVTAGALAVLFALCCRLTTASGSSATSLPGASISCALGDDFTSVQVALINIDFRAILFSNSPVTTNGSSEVAAAMSRTRQEIDDLVEQAISGGLSPSFWTSPLGSVLFPSMRNLILQALAAVPGSDRLLAVDVAQALLVIMNTTDFSITSTPLPSAGRAVAVSPDNSMAYVLAAGTGGTALVYQVPLLPGPGYGQASLACNLTQPPLFLALARSLRMSWVIPTRLYAPYFRTVAWLDVITCEAGVAAGEGVITSVSRYTVHASGVLDLLPAAYQSGSTDGAPANSTFQAITGCALDPMDGGLLVTDAQSCTLRKVREGDVHFARLRPGYFLDTDGQTGDIFMTNDLGNGRTSIGVIQRSSGLFTVIAGDTSACASSQRLPPACSSGITGLAVMGVNLTYVAHATSVVQLAA